MTASQTPIVGQAHRLPSVEPQAARLPYNSSPEAYE